MDAQRQHLEHEEIPLDSQPNLQRLRDAMESIDKDRWISDTTVDQLKEGELKELLPVIDSLVKPYKVATPLPPHDPRCHIYRFKRPKKVAPSDLDIIIPLQILGDTKPTLSAKDSTVELVLGNVYWIKELALVQPDVVVLWVGSYRE
ncbi:hypothetical protein MPH_08997 [Macrophomina phaseolina MS6]|uniref:Uncharacterized protein n=1 Tax=Macrophomina phaseolina (strain MS6) TaxID=1126212 RepID=K2QVP7_MACPH|nr:hypothetical protein MPH_08997 [Macrophomina phaseolina MS6]